MSNTNGDIAKAPSPPVNVDVLLAKCHELLNELEDFQKYIIEQKKEHVVEIRQFRNSVASELKSLERLSQADPTAERTIHTLRSSNLPFLGAVWSIAKASKGIVLFNKRFYWDTSVLRTADNLTKTKKRSVLVDIVAGDGEEWIKVSTTTEARLLFEKAKVGWEGAGSDSESENGDLDGERVVANGESPVQSSHSWGKESDDDNDNRIELLKTAADLQRAAQKVRIRYKRPRIRIVLPKITEGHNPAIDGILASLRATGATIQCGLPFLSLPTLTNGSSAPSLATGPSISTDLHTFAPLLPNPLAQLTPTLNIDCTILLALVSDLSHSTLSPSLKVHRAIRRQIDLEASEKLLPSSLYPAMCRRDLVCTSIAARRMREIVEQIGTPSEKVRTELLLGEGDAGGGKSAGELRASLRDWSEYEVPEEWRLPIRIVKGTYRLENLPAVAGTVEKELTEINRSVFLYGWAEGWTTVSSNRTVAKAIEGIVEGEGQEGNEGPRVWLCATARSLVGKEKGRRD